MLSLALNNVEVHAFQREWVTYFAAKHLFNVILPANISTSSDRPDIFLQHYPESFDVKILENINRQGYSSL